MTFSHSVDLYQKVVGFFTKNRSNLAPCDVTKGLRHLEQVLGLTPLTKGALFSRNRGRYINKASVLAGCKQRAKELS